MTGQFLTSFWCRTVCRTVCRISWYDIWRLTKGDVPQKKYRLHKHLKYRKYFAYGLSTNSPVNWYQKMLLARRRRSANSKKSRLTSIVGILIHYLLCRYLTASTCPADDHEGILGRFLRWLRNSYHVLTHLWRQHQMTCVCIRMRCESSSIKQSTTTTTSFHPTVLSPSSILHGQRGGGNESIGHACMHSSLIDILSVQHSIIVNVI